MDLRALFFPRLKQKSSITVPYRGQMELPIAREKRPDRNYEKGGRSFYFFDFDDNVAFLSSKIFVFEKGTGNEVALSTGEFATISRDVGQRGAFQNYELRFDEETGSFRRFRDLQPSLLGRFIQRRQPFIEDLAEALGYPDFQWKGPSWNTFYHAAYNQRPVSLITARGHSAETIKEGISMLVQRHHLPAEPNYLGIFPVSNSAVRVGLGDLEKKWSIAALKQAAIRQSVEDAIRTYGYSPHHRFGMSDDDPHNIELIVEEMARLKKVYSEMQFFVVETHREQYLKKEVFPDHVRTRPMVGVGQLSFFDK